MRAPSSLVFDQDAWLVAVQPQHRVGVHLSSKRSPQPSPGHSQRVRRVSLEGTLAVSNPGAARGQFDDAEQWCRRSIAISERIGDRLGLATAYGQLAEVVDESGRVHEALDWLIRSASVLDPFPHPITPFVAEYLARLTRQLGMAVLEQRWQDITNCPLPDEVRAFVANHNPEDT